MMALHEEIQEGLKSLSEKVERHLEDTADSLRRFVEKDYLTDEEKKMIDRLPAEGSMEE